MEFSAVRYFRRIELTPDFEPVKSELAVNRSAWHSQTGRQDRVGVQAETNAIPLRGLRRSRIMGRRRRDVHESRYTTLAEQFPATISLLEYLAETLDGELGRAKFARLPPGAVVKPHADRGRYYKRRDRYHCVIESRGGSSLTAGGESVRMQPGEIWWFDNKAIHSARNDSDLPRTHLIFDLLPKGASRHPVNGVESPGVLLTELRQTEDARPLEAVEAAVRLYRAVCRNPDDWQSVLEENNLTAIAERKPLRALARLLWPNLPDSRRRRRESAVAWALAQLDLERIEPVEVASSIKTAGGIRAVHDAWRHEREEKLYADAR